KQPVGRSPTARPVAGSTGVGQQVRCLLMFCSTIARLLDDVHARRAFPDASRVSATFFAAAAFCVTVRLTTLNGSQSASVILHMARQCCRILNSISHRKGAVVS